MPRILPKAVDSRIQWFVDHLPAWEMDPGAIGLTAPEVAALKAKVESADLSRLKASAAKEAAEGATTLLHGEVAGMMKSGRAMLAKIKAAAAADASIYGRALIPVPGSPTHSMTPPPAPRNVGADPLSNGTIRVSWAAALEGVSFFSVWRLDSRSGWARVGAVRRLSFIDDELPAGAQTVSYFVRAHRETGRLALESVESTAVEVRLGRARAEGGAGLARAA